MREIIFRGKHGNKWVYGNYVTTRDNSPPDNDVTIHFIHKNDTAYVVDPETIGQYIGLEDKNGKKIFEGDIVASESWKGGYNYAPVHYGEWNCSCCDGVYGWSFYPEDIRNPEFYEVAGNIHDNPELLEKEDE